MFRIGLLLRTALVLSLVLSTQGLLLVQGAFLLRQDFVVETLCVNRARPELKCDGKCFLSKQLHEHRERERERGAASLEIMLTAGWLLGDGVALPGPAGHDADAYPPRRPPRASASFTSDVFRPPRT